MGVVDNATSRTTLNFWALCSERRYESAAEMMCSSFVHDDRRGALANRITGRDGTMENNRTLVELGFSSVEVEPLAVRGERVALARVTFRTPDGNEIVALQVLETDGDGLRSCCVSFDDEALGDAMSELEARYGAIDDS